jgi:hypothetical protein
MMEFYAGSPLDFTEASKTFRMLLLCRTSRVTIMRVRRTLRGSEIEYYEI